MNITPLDDRIVVRPDEPATMTAGGLYLPAVAQEKPQQGTVLAAGPGRRAESTGELIPLGIEAGIEAGEKVVYSKYGGTEITLDGEDLIILQARDVLAKVVEA